MTKNNPFLRFLEDNNPAEFMKRCQNAAPDWQALFEMQRKNAQAWSQAGQITAKNLQKMAELNRKACTEFAHENTKLVGGLMNTASPEKQIENNAEVMRNWIEKTAENTQTISGLLKTSQEETSELLNERLTESMDELKSCMHCGEESNKAA